MFAIVGFISCDTLYVFCYRDLLPRLVYFFVFDGCKMASVSHCPFSMSAAAASTGDMDTLVLLWWFFFIFFAALMSWSLVKLNEVCDELRGEKSELFSLDDCRFTRLFTTVLSLLLRNYWDVFTLSLAALLFLLFLLTLLTLLLLLFLLLLFSIVLLAVDVLVVVVVVVVLTTALGFSVGRLWLRSVLVYVFTLLIKLRSILFLLPLLLLSLALF